MFIVARTSNSAPGSLAMVRTPNVQIGVTATPWMFAEELEADALARDLNEKDPGKDYKVYRVTECVTIDA